MTPKARSVLNRSTLRYIIKIQLRHCRNQIFLEPNKNSITTSPQSNFSWIKRKQLNRCSVQLFYVGDELSSRLVSKQVLSPQQSLTSVFGMGTGGPSAKKHQLFVRFSRTVEFSSENSINSKRVLSLCTDRSLLLSYGVSDELSSRLVSKQVLSPQQSLTSVFGMGTGGPSAKKH